MMANRRGFQLIYFVFIYSNNILSFIDLNFELLPSESPSKVLSCLAHNYCRVEGLFLMRRFRFVLGQLRCCHRPGFDDGCVVSFLKFHVRLI